MKIWRIGASLAVSLATLLAGEATAEAGPPPPSSYGCNGYVCIGIDGSGTTVDDIYAVVQNPYSSSYATTGTIYDNGVAIHTFPRITLPAYPTKEEQVWDSPSYSFQAGDQVCASYIGISGYPCETIG
jgi:hypothetical protein